MIGWDFRDLKITLRTHESVTLDPKEEDSGILLLSLMYYMYEVTFCNSRSIREKNNSREQQMFAWLAGERHEQLMFHLYSSASSRSRRAKISLIETAF